MAFFPGSDFYTSQRFFENPHNLEAENGDESERLPIFRSIQNFNNGVEVVRQTAALIESAVGKLALSELPAYHRSVIERFIGFENDENARDNLQLLDPQIDESVDLLLRHPSPAVRVWGCYAALAYTVLTGQRLNWRRDSKRLFEAIRLLPFEAALNIAGKIKPLLPAHQQVRFPDLSLYQTGSMDVERLKVVVPQVLPLVSLKLGARLVYDLLTQGGGSVANRMVFVLASRMMREKGSMAALENLVCSRFFKPDAFMAFDLAREVALQPQATVESRMRLIEVALDAYDRVPEEEKSGLALDALELILDLIASSREMPQALKERIEASLPEIARRAAGSSEHWAKQLSLVAWNCNGFRFEGSIAKEDQFNWFCGVFDYRMAMQEWGQARKTLLFLLKKNREESHHAVKERLDRFVANASVHALRQLFDYELYQNFAASNQEVSFKLIQRVVEEMPLQSAFLEQTLLALLHDESVDQERKGRVLASSLALLESPSDALLESCREFIRTADLSVDLCGKFVGLSVGFRPPRPLFDGEALINVLVQEPEIADAKRVFRRAERLRWINQGANSEGYSLFYCRLLSHSIENGNMTAVAEEVQTLRKLGALEEVKAGLHYLIEKNHWKVLEPLMEREIDQIEFTGDQWKKLLMAANKNGTLQEWIKQLERCDKKKASLPLQAAFHVACKCNKVPLAFQIFDRVRKVVPPESRSEFRASVEGLVAAAAESNFSKVKPETLIKTLGYLQYPEEQTLAAVDLLIRKRDNGACNLLMKVKNRAITGPCWKQLTKHFTPDHSVFEAMKEGLQSLSAPDRVSAVASIFNRYLKETSVQEMGSLEKIRAYENLYRFLMGGIEDRATMTRVLKTVSIPFVELLLKVRFMEMRVAGVDLLVRIIANHPLLGGTGDGPKFRGRIFDAVLSVLEEIDVEEVSKSVVRTSAKVCQLACYDPYRYAQAICDHDFEYAKELCVVGLENFDELNSRQKRVLSTQIALFLDEVPKKNDVNRFKLAFELLEHSAARSLFSRDWLDSTEVELFKCVKNAELMQAVLTSGGKRVWVEGIKRVALNYVRQCQASETHSSKVNTNLGLNQLINMCETLFTFEYSTPDIHPVLAEVCYKSRKILVMVNHARGTLDQSAQELWDLIGKKGVQRDGIERSRFEDLFKMLAGSLISMKGENLSGNSNYKRALAILCTMNVLVEMELHEKLFAQPMSPSKSECLLKIATARASKRLDNWKQVASLVVRRMDWMGDNPYEALEEFIYMLLDTDLIGNEDCWDVMNYLIQVFESHLSDEEKIRFKDALPILQMGNQALFGITDGGYGTFTVRSKALEERVERLDGREEHWDRVIDCAFRAKPSLDDLFSGALASICKVIVNHQSDSNRRWRLFHHLVTRVNEDRVGEEEESEEELGVNMPVLLATHLSLGMVRQGEAVDDPIIREVESIITQLGRRHLERMEAKGERIDI